MDPYEISDNSGPLDDNKKFFVANLDYSTTASDVKGWFTEQFGPVSHVKLIYDNATGKSKGYGFVYLQTDESCYAASIFANSHNYKVTMLGKKNVHLQKNDERRVKPRRDEGRTNNHHDGPKKKRDNHSHTKKGQHHYGQNNQEYSYGVPVNNVTGVNGSSNMPQYQNSAYQSVLPVPAQSNVNDGSNFISYQQPSTAYNMTTPQTMGYPQHPQQQQQQQPQQTYQPPDPNSTNYQHLPINTTIPQYHQPQQSYLQPTTTTSTNIPAYGVPVPAPAPVPTTITGSSSNTQYLMPQAQTQYQQPQTHQQQQVPQQQYQYPQHLNTTMSAQPQQQQGQQYYNPSPATNTSSFPQTVVDPQYASSSQQVYNNMNILSSYQPNQLGLNTGVNTGMGLAYPASQPQPSNNNTYIPQPPSTHPNTIQQQNTKIILLNLPPTIEPTDIVRYLSQKWKKTPRRCTLETDPNTKNTKIAHLDFHSSNDANEIIQLANSGVLNLRGNVISAMMDTNPPPDGSKRIPVGVGATGVPMATPVSNQMSSNGVPPPPPMQQHQGQQQVQMPYVMNGQQVQQQQQQQQQSRYEPHGNHYKGGGKRHHSRGGGRGDRGKGRGGGRGHGGDKSRFQPY